MPSQPGVTLISFALELWEPEAPAFWARGSHHHENPARRASPSPPSPPSLPHHKTSAGLQLPGETHKGFPLAQTDARAEAGDAEGRAVCPKGSLEELSALQTLQACVRLGAWLYLEKHSSSHPRKPTKGLMPLCHPPRSQGGSRCAPGQAGTEGTGSVRFPSSSWQSNTPKPPITQTRPPAHTGPGNFTRVLSHLV